MLSNRISFRVFNNVDCQLLETRVLFRCDKMFLSFCHYCATRPYIRTPAERSRLVRDVGKIRAQGYGRGTATGRFANRTALGAVVVTFSAYGFIYYLLNKPLKERPDTVNKVDYILTAIGTDSNKRAEETFERRRTRDVLNVARDHVLGGTWSAQDLKDMEQRAAQFSENQDTDVFSIQSKKLRDTVIE